MPSFDIASSTPVDLIGLALNLLVAAILSAGAQWHYRVFSQPLASRKELALIFPFITMTTVLIITVVKSSLALSLGLIGALSIIRFRTPIKEPEELAYLFFSIAIGLGLGAGHMKPTVVAAVCILILAAGFKWKNKAQSQPNLHLNMAWDAGNDQEATLNQIVETIIGPAKLCQLRRVDARADHLHVTFMVEGVDDVSTLLAVLKKRFPEASITFVTQSNVQVL